MYYPCDTVHLCITYDVELGVLQLYPSAKIGIVGASVYARHSQ